ncbi:MAG: glycosyltransferase family 39 protein [Dehalococcoidia bacterium]
METIKSLIKKIDQYISLKGAGISLLAVSILLILIEYIWDDSVGNLMNISVLVVLAIVLAFLIVAVILNKYLGRYLRARGISLSGLRERFAEWQSGQSETVRTVSRAALALLLIFPIILLTLVAVETFWEGSVSYHINLNALIISTIAAELIAIIAVMVMLYRSRLRTGRSKPSRPAPRTLASVIRAERAAAGLSTPDVAPAETMAGHGKRRWVGRVARVATMALFLVLLLVLALQAIFDLTSLEGSRTGLIVATVIFGIMFFWMNRQKLKVTVKIEEEGAEEAERKRSFGTRFPRINRVPIFRWFIRWMYKEGWWYSAALLLCCFLFLGFGTHHLGQFMTVDEPKWVDTRVPQLYDSLASGDWEGTYINDKPGVLPSLLAGTVNFFMDHEEYKADPLIYENYLFYWRLPIVIFNFLMLFLIYHFLKKLLRKNHALLVTGLVALNPILIGISQIVNPDATLWSVSFLSFITFFLYLKTNKLRYIIYSGVFLGLALICKYFAAIFYVIFFLSIYLEYLSRNTTREQFFSRCLHILALYVISIIIYTILFPATWVEPSRIIKGTIGAGILTPGLKYFLLILLLIFIELIALRGRITKYLKSKFDIPTVVIYVFSSLTLIALIVLMANIFLNNALFDFNHYIFYESARGEVSFYKDLFTSSYMTAFTMTFPILFGICFWALILPLKKRLNINITNQDKFLISIIFLTMFVYIVGSSLGGFVTSCRYQIMLYPLYSILSATFFIYVFKHTKIVTTALIAAALITTFFAAPYFLLYNNHLNIKDYRISYSWGMGGYKLAQIVNSWDNAENMVVWVDVEGFDRFFIGTSYWRGRDNPFNEELEIEYLVLSSHIQPIWEKHVKAYEEGERYLYARVAAETPLIEYYTYEPIEKICINNNPNDCIWIVEVRE